MVLEENMAVEGEPQQQEQQGEQEDEDEEYESDPEEAALSLAMRRREASDDEEEGEGEGQRIDNHHHHHPRVEIGSDGESDGQGGVEAYDDDEEEEESEIGEEEGGEDGDGDGDGDVEDGGEYEGRGSEDGDNGEDGVRQAEVGEDEERSNAEQVNNEQEEGEGEKKENEPFAVPTAGAFYMHDDRFRENGAGRHRRTLGGRKLWESKDDRKWGHDKFEEMNMREKQYDKEGRNSRGQYRGRGKTRGLDRRQGRGNRPRAFDSRNTPNQPVRSVRGRGPRRYEPTTKNNFRETPSQNKQAGKSHESTSNANSGRVAPNSRTSNVQSDSAPPRKHVFASSLNSASPPFYPSGSSNQNITQAQRRELTGGVANKNLRPSAISENKIPSAHPATMARGKNVPDAVDKLYYDDVPQNVYGKLSNLQLQSSGPSPIITTQSPQNKSKGRGVGVPEQQPSYRQSSSFNPSSKVPQQTQVSAVYQRPHQNTVQTSFRSSQQLGQHPSGVSQASSPPKASPTSSSEPGDIDSPPGSSKSQTALVGKGKTSAQGNGRGSFLYNGALIGASGSMAVSHGDQNFPAQALLQVMQFGGQHPGGLGVPAVGMALPGYVAQPQHGFGNSEMTWVPVLAGAAGALGASYPYLVDGGYYSRPSGQPSSSSASSKETSADNPNNAVKAPQRAELVSDEFGQRQNQTRRYSKMNFGP